MNDAQNASSRLNYRVKKPLASDCQFVTSASSKTRQSYGPYGLWPNWLWDYDYQVIRDKVISCKGARSEYALGSRRLPLEGRRPAYEIVGSW